MDSLTHGLISLLLGQNFGLTYGFYAMFMGTLPDLDVMLIPLAKKYKKDALEHRGGTHSFLFVAIASPLCALITNALFPADFWLYLITGFLVTTVHLFCDMLTTSAVRPFWPFNQKNVRWDIEHTGNPIAFIGSFWGGWLLFHFLLFRKESLFSLFTVIFSVAISAIMVSRVIFKSIVKRRFQSAGKYHIIPTPIPFSWNIIQNQQLEKEIDIKIAKYNAIRPQELNYEEYKIQTEEIHPPITNDSQALCFTYRLPEVREHLKRRKFPLYFIEGDDADESWTIYWFSVETTAFHHTVGLCIELERSGKYNSSFSRLNLKKARAHAS